MRFIYRSQTEQQQPVLFYNVANYHNNTPPFHYEAFADHFTISTPSIVAFEFQSKSWERGQTIALSTAPGAQLFRIHILYINRKCLRGGLYKSGRIIICTYTESIRRRRRSIYPSMPKGSVNFVVGKLPTHRHGRFSSDYYDDYSKLTSNHRVGFYFLLARAATLIWNWSNYRMDARFYGVSINVRQQIKHNQRKIIHVVNWNRVPKTFFEMRSTLFLDVVYGYGLII